MRVICILHAEHVVDLTLEPVRGGPDAYDTFDRLPLFNADLDTQMLVLRKRIKDVNDFEFFGFRPMNGGFIDQIFEWHQVVIPKKYHYFGDSVLLELDLVLAQETV